MGPAWGQGVVYLLPRGDQSVEKLTKISNPFSAFLGPRHSENRSPSPAVVHWWQAKATGSRGSRAFSHVGLFTVLTY